MGRPEKPVRTPNHGLMRLAMWLRAHRDLARLTYAELAQQTVYSATTLQRATTGERIPRLPVVEAYARACGGSVEEARRLWRCARRNEQKLTQRWSIPSAVPTPDLVREPAELVAALKALYYKSGALPLMEMERRAGGHGRLPHSSVHRLLKGAGMLRQDQLTAFLTVCGVPEREHLRWQRAWGRAWRHRQREGVVRDYLQNMTASYTDQVHSPRAVELGVTVEGLSHHISLPRHVSTDISRHTRRSREVARHRGGGD